MSEHHREFDDSLIDVADELVARHTAEGAIERLQRRRQTTNDELALRCTEAIAWIKRERLDDES